MKIKTNLTRKMAGRLVAEFIKNHYLGDTMDRTIGMTADGKIDYEFDVHGGDVVVPFYRTANGWTLGDGDYWTSEFWNDEILDYLADQFAGDWHPDLDQLNEEFVEDIDIVYWTDADNPEDCVNRVLNGDIIE